LYPSALWNSPVEMINEQWGPVHEKQTDAINRGRVAGLFLKPTDMSTNTRKGKVKPSLP
jgi:hypothetical protein